MYPSIRNVSHPAYKNANKRRVSWEVIGRKYGMDGKLYVAEFFIDTFAPIFNNCEQGRGDFFIIFGTFKLYILT